MRGVSTRVWVGAALVAVLVVLAVPAAWADDPPAATDPPQARVQPPGGSPEIREQSLVDLFLIWLREQAGVLLP